MDTNAYAVPSDLSALSREELEALVLATSSERRQRELNSLNQMAQAVIKSLKLSDVLQNIIEEVSQLVQAEGVVVLLKDDSAETLTFAAVSGPGSRGLEGEKMPADVGIAGYVLQTGRPHEFSTQLENSNEVEIYRDVERITGFITRHMLVAPIMVDEKPFGVLEAARSKGERFGTGALQLLVMASHWAAIAIENARLFEAERTARLTAETLQAANLALTESLDIDNVLQQMLAHLHRFVPYGRAFIILLKDDWLEIRAHRGYDAAWAEMQQTSQNRDVLLNYPLLARIVNEKVSLLVADTAVEPNWATPDGLPTIRNWLGVPLITSGRVIGIFSLDHAEPHFFTPTHQQRTESLAWQAAVALENAQLYEKQIEQYRALQVSQARLTQAEKMGALGRLTASIAHEINNPIQAIQGFVSLAQEELEQSPDHGKIGNYLEIIDLELNRVAQIVYQMNQFYRPTSPAFEPVDVVAALKSTLRLSQHQLRDNNITLQENIDPQLPYVWGNGGQLRQIFLNLLLNAIDAMPTGGELRISLSLDKMVKAQRTEGKLSMLPASSTAVPALRLIFQDDGEGIDPDLLDHLFEPFITTKEQGSGLGLSITYQLIEAHNGRIIVETELHQGTTFTIWLPTHQPRHAQQP